MSGTEHLGTWDLATIPRRSLDGAARWGGPVVGKQFMPVALVTRYRKWRVTFLAVTNHPELGWRKTMEWNSLSAGGQKPETPGGRFGSFRRV